MAGKFEIWTNRDLEDLIDAYPLASIVSSSPGYIVSEMPMLLDLDANGTPVSLTGHLPRNGPHAGILHRDPAALFIFRGANGYISPGTAGKKDWAPTWNFAVAHVVAEVQLDDRLTDESLERVVAHMERERKEPWSIADLGSRYQSLRAAVIGFRAPIRSIQARFKLGQDETPDTLQTIVQGVGDEALAGWMRRFNPSLMDTR
ncbi:FMN-binding negative transcriptional regulator [Mesorhizobium sp. NZP2298]|uniref:FMN-binding negative transcriptional regulator n=1 Tax=Mesorhizobium sp. NZP2298 TaxID=2483403 RepID=UPI001553C1A9|nr:FMN-binding negative transcriptional regulator [Mesorhizobium sp. NZP2298]